LNGNGVVVRPEMLRAGRQPNWYRNVTGWTQRSLSNSERTRFRTCMGLVWALYRRVGSRKNHNIDMPQKAVLAADVNDRKKAKTGSKRKPGERVKVPIRKPRPECKAQELMGKDDAYNLRVGGGPGEYRVDMDEGAPIAFYAKRFSDYDTALKNENGKIIGRRPRPVKDFAKFADIMNQLKGKGEKWVDEDAPQQKDGYREEDMIREPFAYRQAKEVWPNKVRLFQYHCF
jgi:hypothetical protein